MSPTSYQTAPPRDSESIIGTGPRRVKRILNKINHLAKPLILLELTLGHQRLHIFASLGLRLLQIYHRLVETVSEDKNNHVHFLILHMVVDVRSWRCRNA